MSSKEPISTGKIDPKVAADNLEKKEVPKASEFQQHMGPEDVKTQNAPNTPQQIPTGVSPMELAKGPAFQTAGPNLHSLLAQVNSADGDLSDIRKKLGTPNLKFKRQHQQLLKNKLEDANSHLRSANGRMGAEVPDPTKVPDTANPVERFLGYVSDGQNQLLAAKAQLQELGQTGTANPADLMLVQIKLSQAQQELEYSSILLSKVVDIFKQMLNIQL